MNSYFQQKLFHEFIFSVKKKKKKKNPEFIFSVKKKKKKKKKNLGKYESPLTLLYRIHAFGNQAIALDITVGVN